MDTKAIRLKYTYIGGRTQEKLKRSLKFAFRNMAECFKTGSVQGQACSVGTRSELLPQHRKRIRKEHVNSCTAQPLVVPKKQREAGEANVDQTVQIEQAVCRLPAARAAQRPSTASGTSRTWHHSSGQRRQGPTALGAPSDPLFLSPPRTAVPIGSRCSASIHFTAPISDQIRRTEKHKTGKHDPQKTHRPGRDGQQAHAIIPENKNKPVLSSSATDEQQRGRG